ncbi:MAG: lipoyl(octanoyl) transferase LipB [Elusimicrobiota bacterium]
MDVRVLGLMDYVRAWETQKDLVEQRLSGRIGDTLLLLEHHPVFTCGASSRALPPVFLPHPYHVIERGGDITYHGPGQLVGYPIVDLNRGKLSAVGHLRLIENALIAALDEFNLDAHRIKGFTGVWIEGRKIASIGVAVKRGVSFHGFALNVHCDLSPFHRINPCNLEPEQMTTMEKCLERPLEMNAVIDSISKSFSRHFGARRTELLQGSPASGARANQRV